MPYREAPSKHYGNVLTVAPHPNRSTRPTIWHRYEQLPVYGKFLILGFIITIALLLAAIPVHGDGQDACLIIGTILGGVSSFMLIPGLCEFDGRRYKRRLMQAAYTHKLPATGSIYDAVPVGEYVEIWEGNREDGWRRRYSFHAEEENDKAMEAWSNLQNSNGTQTPAPEATALANILNGA